MNPTKWKWLPPWNMPADPVQAVLWFLRWLLQVVVRYFAILLVAGVAYETYLNGIVGLLGTLLVGLLLWGGLFVVLVITNVTSSVSRLYNEMSRVSQRSASFSDPFSAFTTRAVPSEDENVVEGTIITDLDEERRKRRQEM